MLLTNPLLVVRIAIPVGVEIKAGRQNQRHQRFMFAAMRVIDALHSRTAALKFPVGNPQSSRAGRATLHTEAIRGDEEIGKTPNGGHLDARVDQNADLGRFRLTVGFASNSVGFTHSFGHLAWR
jgi:hypothetical protein